MYKPIILHKLKLHVNDDILEISASFGMEKTGLVGKNGSGKTSLLRVITGQTRPQSGLITGNDNFLYLPQDYQFDLNQTVVEALGIEEKLNAVSNLKQDPTNERLLQIIGKDWDIKEKALARLSEFGISRVSLSKRLYEFSGGERMKIAIAGLFLFQDKFLILDEPTNNLDQNSKELLYHYINNWRNGLLIVSHDRQLLSIMDRIAELSSQGLKIYGGNYEFFEAEKQNERQTALRLYTSARQDYKKIKTQAQAVLEMQEKRTSHAKKRAETQNIPKILLGAMQRSGQKTAGKLKTLHDKRVTDAEQRLQRTKDNIQPSNQIHVDMSNTEVPKGKLMASFDNVSFDYSDKDTLIKDFNLTIYGQERIAIAGSNGSGKTTLIKLMLNKLAPKSGDVKLGTDKISYLDQEVGILEGKYTILENVEKISKLGSDEARKWLAGFLFFKRDVFKKVDELSGGERIRAGLATVLAGKKPAQLLVLDEPTNNLDLDSIEKIESALMHFRGTLIVISHDAVFLDKIGIDRFITLGLLQ